MANVFPMRPALPKGVYRKSRPEAPFDVVDFVGQFLTRDTEDDNIIDRLIAAAHTQPTAQLRPTQHIKMQSEQHQLHLSLGPDHGHETQLRRA